MKPILTVLSVFFVLSFSSCTTNKSAEANTKTITESQETVEEIREIASYSSISISSVLKVILTDSLQGKILLKADKDIIPFVKTEIKGNRLEIYRKKSDNYKKKDIILYVPSQGVNEILASGVTIIETQNEITADAFSADFSGVSKGNLNLKTNHIKLNLSGVSEVTLNGAAQTMDLIASGSSKVNAKGFITQKTEVNVSGACNIELFAEESIAGTLSGASSITANKPKIQNIEASGVSSVNWR
ncbi:MAG: head GIN domain-containing protein [Capnocytophaga sp.]|nr:head GIN domain-containing protein [Capnocytophaga sp.]